VFIVLLSFEKVKKAPEMVIPLQTPLPYVCIIHDFFDLSRAFANIFLKMSIFLEKGG